MNLRKSKCRIIFINVLTAFLVLIMQSCSYKKVVTKPVIAEKETVYKVITEKEIVHDTVIEKEFIECAQQPVNVTVYFSFDSYELSPESKRILDATRDNPFQPLLVTGYADIIGTDIYNYTLGLKRSRVVYEYLGLAEPHIMQSKGEGDCTGLNIYCRKVVVSGQL